MNKWLQQFKEILLHEFGESIQFIGLQGSHARNEATENSDIDVVVIFDTLSIDKLKRYEVVVQTMSDRHLLCGFVGGMDDLNSWDKADLFTFIYDTKTVYGQLAISKTAITTAHVKKYVRSTAGNIYHMTLHNYLHGKSTQMIHDLFKNARFAIQGNVFLQQTEFISQLNELSTVTKGYDTDVITRLISLKNNAQVDLEKDTELLFAWSKEILQSVKDDTLS